jgi:signal peptidase
LSAAKRLRLALLVLALFASLVALAGVASAGPGGASNRMAVVRGHSMEPLLHTGDIVFLSRKPPEDIAVGDIIVYRWGNSYVIHRVVYKYHYAGSWCFVVQGDNRLTNPVPDPGDLLECGSIVYIDPLTEQMVTASGIPYSRVVGVVVSVHGYVLKIPYLGGLALLIK